VAKTAKGYCITAPGCRGHTFMTAFSGNSIRPIANVPLTLHYGLSLIGPPMSADNRPVAAIAKIGTVAR